jgi:hypothetical protein
MSKLYKREPSLNAVYKDGSRAKDLGAALSTNPFPISTEAYWAWVDGWNKTAIEFTPKRSTMNFNTGTTTIDPGTGQVALNTAAFATATNIKLNFTTIEGSNILQLIDSFVAGEKITLYNKADPTNFAVYTVQSQTVTTYATLAVTYVSSAGSFFTAAQPLVVQIG